MYSFNFSNEKKPQKTVKQTQHDQTPPAAQPSLDQVASQSKTFSHPGSAQVAWTG